jgi:uncharacterized protein YbjQ (UPF0145 family)
MGRTVITYRMMLETLARKWESYRRALRRDDREAFDRLMDKARAHSSAASFDIQPDPTESMFLSMLLEHEKELNGLRQKEKPQDVSRGD